MILQRASGNKLAISDKKRKEYQDSGKTIGAVCCLLCAFLWYGISRNRDSREPTGFWSGEEEKRKATVRNVQAYNGEMARLYRKCSLACVLSGVLFLLLPLPGGISPGFDCTVGRDLVWRAYKKVLGKYS